MTGKAFRIVGVGLAPLLFSPENAGSFVLPASLSTLRSPSEQTFLLYGPHGSSEEGNDINAPAFANNGFEKQASNEIDPSCDADDEDCIAFSSLDDQPLPFISSTNEDPLCDPQDVDCQAFLPQTDLHSDTSLAAELHTRSNSIEKERIDHNWKTAHCPTTFVSVSNADWVRRVDMQEYPIAVCGGARGGVYVVNLEEKTVVGKVEGAHFVQAPGGFKMAKQAMEKLYGKLDGGGVVAVAIRGDLVASSGREGGVRLWRLVEYKDVTSPAMGGGDGSDPTEGSGVGKLVPLGSLHGLQNTIITSLKFDSNDLLWAACYDGTVRAFTMTGYDDPTVRFPPQKAVFHSDFTGKPFGRLLSWFYGLSLTQKMMS